MGGFKDITGARFGRLTVTGKGRSRSKQTSWDCICDCGKSVNVLKHSLICGATKSCGCYMKDRSAAEIVARSTTHGMRHSAEYSVWSGMKRRCENKNEKSYARYGAIGIEVRFKSFEDFFSHVGPRPTIRHSIDRIDASGHYEPGNVRWATISEQARNKRNSIMVDVMGEVIPLKEACERVGASYQKVWQRIKKHGWSADKALGI